MFIGDFEDRNKLESIGLRVPVLPKLAQALDDLMILFREVSRCSHIGAHVVHEDEYDLGRLIRERSRQEGKNCNGRS